MSGGERPRNAPRTLDDLQTTLRHDPVGNSYVITYTNSATVRVLVDEDLQKFIHCAFAHWHFPENDVRIVIHALRIRNVEKITNLVLSAIFRFIDNRPHDDTPEGRYWAQIRTRDNNFQDHHFRDYVRIMVENLESRITRQTLSPADKQRPLKSKMQEMGENVFDKARVKHQHMVHEARKARHERVKGDERELAEREVRLAERITAYAPNPPAFGGYVRNQSQSDPTLENVTTQMDSISLTSAVNPVRTPGGYLPRASPLPQGGSQPYTDPVFDYYDPTSDAPASWGRNIPQPQFNQPAVDTNIVQQSHVTDPYYGTVWQEPQANQPAVDTNIVQQSHVTDPYYGTVWPQRFQASPSPEPLVEPPRKGKYFPPGVHDPSKPSIWQGDAPHFRRVAPGYQRGQGGQGGQGDQPPSDSHGRYPSSSAVNQATANQGSQRETSSNRAREEDPQRRAERPKDSRKRSLLPEEKNKRSERRRQ